MDKRQERADYHHAAYAFIKIHFALLGANLEYIQEHELGEKPLRVDFIVIKKSPDEKLTDAIGEFFRVVNILEIKSPEDSLSIDDFFKVQAYGLLYKVLDHKVDELPIKDMTLTLMRDSYPREMFKALKKYNFTVTSSRSGIYNVDTGNFIPVRVMITSQMSDEDLAELKLMTRNVTQDDVKIFMTQAASSHDHNIIENAGAALRFFFIAHKELGKKVTEGFKMKDNDIIKEIFGDLFEEDKQKAEQKAVVNDRERVATDMLKRKYPLEAILEISRLSSDKILALATQLGVSVVS